MYQRNFINHVIVVYIVAAPQRVVLTGSSIYFPNQMSNGSAIKNPHVKELAVLQRKPNKNEAYHLLRDIAHRISFIMKEQRFKVGSIVEFYPKDKRLLGMNVNRGMKIMLRLRNSSDEYQFLSREAIMGTMLHELTHNLFGPHDNKFYSKLDELTGRQWVIEQQGLFDTFLGSGHRLGGLAIREQRMINNKRILKLSGKRLGVASSEQSKFSPREMAARAATRRANDNRWCGDGKEGIENLIPDSDDLTIVEENSEIAYIDKEKKQQKGQFYSEPEEEPKIIEIIDLT